MNIVILGAGQAASQCALGLRQSGFEGSITMVGDEPHLPYERPPLSKAVLKSETDIERTVFRPAAVYEDQDIGLKLSTKATKVDQAQQQVTLDNGEVLAYDKLVVATGTRARSLPLDQGVLDKSFLVRSWDESLALKAFLEAGSTGKPLAVIGGGFIGLEVAASARKLGWEVVILEAGPRLMGRAVHPRISELALNKHRAEGAKVYLETLCRSYQASDAGVTLDLGSETIEAAALVIGIGALVNVECLEGTSIHDPQGIRTNAAQQTSDPNIYAIGDVAVCDDRFLASGVRLESVQNAIYGAKLCVAHITTGKEPRLEAPWFWTDQYDYSLQMVGLYNESYTWLERDNGDGSVALIGLEGEIVRAGQTINASKDFAVLRRAIDGQMTADAQELADMSISLKQSILKR